MTMGVINLLEIIDIKHQQAGRSMLRPFMYLMLGNMHKLAAVAELGQLVGMCQLLQNMEIPVIQHGSEKITPCIQGIGPADI